MYISPLLLEELEKKFGDGVWISGDLGDQANVRCPNCIRNMGTEDQSGHLGLNFRLNVAHCVRCDWGCGNLGDWLSKTKGLSSGFTIGSVFKSIRSFLEEIKEVPFNPDVGAFLPRDCVKIGKNTDPVYFESLEAKGILWQEMRDESLLYTVNDSYHSGYVIFPFFEGDEVVYWQGRAAYKELLADPKSKKRNPKSKEGLGKATWLYGLHAIKPESHIYLVEGTLDKISLQRWLKKEKGEGHYAASLQGTAISFPGPACHTLNSQWGKLKRLNPASVNLVFDPDALEKSKALAKTLQSTGLNARAIQTIGKDPNESIKENYDGFTKSFNASLGGDLQMLAFELGLPSI